MVRFEDIRETLRSGVEPLDICKALTERANQAGGHDNITVIIVQFDGQGLQPLAPDGEPLKYRKYVLPDEAVEEKTAPIAPQPAAGPSLGPPPVARPDGQPRLPSLRPPVAWQEAGQPPGVENDYDRVDIPGTHVPIWIVVGIVIGVVVLLAGTAFLLLR
jgi:protein phosphatase